MFKAAKKKNPDILSYAKAMRNYDNLKDWLAVALKEIKQLEGKGVWVVLNQKSATTKLYHAHGCFDTSATQLVKSSNAEHKDALEET